MGNLQRLTVLEQTALVRFKKEVAEICGTAGWEIRIFGSRARQEGDEESDVDVLVVLKGYTEGKKIKIWDAAYFIFSDTDVLISPVVLSWERYEQLKKRERLIAKDIEKEGFVL